MSDVKGKSTSGRGLTPKQEKFCQLYIELGNASEAYRQSYDCSKMTTEVINVKASELLNKNGKITVRVEELRQAHQQRHNLTLDNIIADLQEYRDICMGRKPLTITTVVKMLKKERHKALIPNVSFLNRQVQIKPLNCLGSI